MTRFIFKSMYAASRSRLVWRFNVVLWVSCTGMFTPVSRTDRRIAKKQSDQLGIFDIRSSFPAAATGGVEGSFWGIDSSSAVDTYRRQRCAHRRPVKVYLPVVRLPQELRLTEDTLTRDVLIMEGAQPQQCKLCMKKNCTSTFELRRENPFCGKKNSKRRSVLCKLMIV